MNEASQDSSAARAPRERDVEATHDVSSRLDIPYVAEFDIGGYEWMEGLVGSEWQVVSSWGRDGWDLGSWPLVCVAHFNGGERGYAVARYTEGDVTVEGFATRRERDARTDEMALSAWRQFEHGPADLPESVEDLKPEYRGPYSRMRLDREGPRELPERGQDGLGLPGPSLS